MWSICDSRDDTCNHQEENCQLIKWDGEFCEWNGRQCVRAEDTKEPEMVMYSKQYKDYFNPSDNNEYRFKLTLGLGVYGATDMITIEDHGETWNFGTDGQGCTTPPGLKLVHNKVTIEGLPSGVIMEFTCVFPHSINKRWDVTKLIE
jgi:hypothetical protein